MMLSLRNPVCMACNEYLLRKALPGLTENFFFKQVLILFLIDIGSKMFNSTLQTTEENSRIHHITIVTSFVLMSQCLVNKSRSTNKYIGNEVRRWN